MTYILAILEQLCDRLENMKIGNTEGSQVPDQQASQSLKVMIESQNSDEVRKAEENQNKQELLRCLKLHSKILEISGKIEKYFSIMIMIQVLMTAVILCTTMYAMTVVSSSFTSCLNALNFPHRFH
jgi:hypothetical protein